MPDKCIVARRGDARGRRPTVIEGYETVDRARKDVSCRFRFDSEGVAYAVDLEATKKLRMGTRSVWPFPNPEIL